MDIFDRLKNEHEYQKRLMKHILDTEGDSKTRRTLFAELRTELEAHAAAEEQTLYATLLAKPDGTDTARHSIAEHQSANKIVAELAEMDMSSAGWLQRFKALQHEVLHHIEEEEEDVFPSARALMDDDKPVEMRREYAKRKPQEAAQRTA